MPSSKKWKKFQTGIKAILIDQHGVTAEKAGEYCQHLKQKDSEWQKMQESAKDVAGNLSASKIINAYKSHNTRSVTGGQNKPTVCGAGGHSGPGAPPKGSSAKASADNKKKSGDDQRHGSWSDCQPSRETPLILLETGSVAEKLDLDEDIGQRTGYIFCRVEKALSVLRKLDGKVVKPIAFVLEIPRIDVEHKA